MHSRKSRAVKIDYLDRGSSSTLETEYDAYKTIQAHGEASGIPKCYFYQREEGYVALVLQRLGRPLGKIRSTSSLSQKSVLMIGIQVLKRIEAVHNAGYLHRDITPLNIMTGYKGADRIYLVDFGIAKRYKDKCSGKHISYRTDTGGCRDELRFRSANSDLDRELSRRDDLEGLGHVLLYLFRGRLPWDRVDFESHVTRAEMKRMPLEKLCSGMSSSFSLYFAYVRSLHFSEKPSYSYLTGLFNRALEARGFEDDRKFDWMR